MMNRLISDIYSKCYGTTPKLITKLSASGSNRQYFRIFDDNDNSIIATLGIDNKENNAFINLANRFHQEGIKVPEILYIDESSSIYFQEDLGDNSLFSQLNNKKSELLVSKTITSLATLQTIDNIDYSVCYPEPMFDYRLILWDLNYFKYCFLKPVLSDFNEVELEKDFNLFANDILSTPKSMWGFMYRDCQSRNVMIKDDEPFWIDFQGGRFGPCLYDIASFLWQAKAQFSETFRQKMINIYFDEYSSIRKIDKEELAQRLYDFVLLRTLQVLGAYGFRGLIQHKAHFIQSIPPALKNLSDLIKRGSIDKYPTLKYLCQELINTKRFDIDDYDSLTITIFSFSYKKGYPEDLSGNGGGFMFDCRAMHNPGRYPEYQNLTGRDREVKDFLEERGEVQTFIQNAYAITKPSIERYIKRGFTNLQIGFGCTGGQHRSVYCAESMADLIKSEYPNVRVKLIHREQNISTTYIGEQLI